MSLHVHQAELRALCGPVHMEIQMSMGKKEIYKSLFSFQENSLRFYYGAAGEVFVYK